MELSELGEVRRAFLEAPFSESGWMGALERFADATRSTRAQIVGIGEGATLFNHTTHVDPGYQREFNEIAGWRPDVNWRVAVTGAPLEVLSERHYAIARAGLASDVYDDHCRRWGGLYGAQTALMQEPGELIGLAVLRDEREGRTTARDRRVFADGAAHALAAVNVQRAMANRGAALLAGSLEAIGLAAFLLGTSGRVVAMTAEAEELLRRPEPLRLASGELVSTHGTTSFAAAIARAVGRGASAGVERLWFGAAGDPEFLRIDVLPVPRPAVVSGRDVHALVIARAATNLSDPAGEELQRGLGLTGAEAAVALRLANGMARSDIAAERGTSTHTLATQIRSTLAKSGVSREAELVAMINKLLR